MNPINQLMIKAFSAFLLVAVADMFTLTEAVAADPNSFNRLMKPPSKRNPPPTKDGIHDPDGTGAQSLQTPKESFAKLPKSKSGNYVDWVKALDDGNIQPRYDRVDTDAQPVVMDLNIVREVKGSMPNVVYPHKQHTEWLDCSNCHPAIFLPEKGANNISMASILLGEQCGVCHGKVAFPVSECRRCHSQPKDKQAASAVKTKASAKP
jgi:c(7)-type cytochrome triheme protein